MFEFNHRSTGFFDPGFHSHPYYELYYFHEGKCNYLIGDQIYALQPGDLILMYGMTLHRPKVDPDYPYIRTIVHFDPALVHPYLDHAQAVDVLQPFRQFGNCRLCLRGEDKEEAERILSTMREHQLRGDKIGDNRLMLAFVDLLYSVYDKLTSAQARRETYSSDKDKTVQAVVAWLEKTYTEDLSMERLERELHLSKSYLAKIFKEVTGVTIFEYVYRKRVNEAKIRFLLRPGLTATEVSYQLGFKHLAHFSRLFKQYAGQTPESYKKQLKG